MTVTRTIEIYEYIPLQELRDELDEDEVLLVESINRFVKGIRDMRGGLHKYSWDEVLRYTYAEDDFENLQRYVMSDFKERRNVSDSRWNYRGTGLMSLMPSLKEVITDKFDDLLTNPMLKPASHDALCYWMFNGIRNTTITHMEEVSKLKGEQADELLVCKSVAIGVRVALERSVVEKGDTKAKMQDWAIRDVIRDNGFDWKTFECGKDTLTVECLHQACQELKPNLFRMGKDTFRTQVWQGFRARRKHKLDANISIASLKLRVEPDKP